MEQLPSKLYTAQMKKRILQMKPERMLYLQFLWDLKESVAAEAVDNVEHTSGLVNADGSIIEDDEIHNQTSSIDITETVLLTN